MDGVVFLWQKVQSLVGENLQVLPEDILSTDLLMRGKFLGVQRLIRQYMQALL